MIMKDAIPVVVDKLVELGIGQRQVNYKMRDAGWSRQRYWGEPFPVIYRGDMPYAMNEKDLPLKLPPSNNFKPTGTGEGPLANLKDWIQLKNGERRDSNTMPTHAGAAWYFLRYMDPHNPSAFADKGKLDYWGQVDVYIGGSEHAVAHLLYSRLWVKILRDLGYLNFDEPFKKLINQGKITGDSRFVYRATLLWHTEAEETTAEKAHPKVVPALFISDGVRQALQENNETVQKRIRKQLDLISKIYVEKGLATHGEFRLNQNPLTQEGLTPLHVDVNIVNGLDLDMERFRKWQPQFSNAEFITEEDGRYLCGSAIEKMSKSKYNVVNPDDIIEKYGADTLRLYEMFLGPLEQSKPWNTNGIDGVYKFLRRFWNLFHDDKGNWTVSSPEPTRAELKVLHKTLKKVEQDIGNFSFNTSVSEFMICANELTAL